MDTLWQDLKFAIRKLGKSPSFVAVAVISLALGIGANTAIFTLVKAVFLHVLPVFEPHRLVSLFTLDEKYSGLVGVSKLNFDDIRERQSVFSGMTMYTYASFSASIGDADTKPWIGELVDSNFFEVLGVPPVVGRTFSGLDTDASGKASVMIINHGVWIRAFGGDPSVIGTKLTLNRQPVTIIGVMPAGFRGVNLLREPSAWLPMSMAPVILPRPGALKERKALYFNVVARLKPGVSQAQALASLAPISAQLATQFPDVNGGRSLGLLSAAQATITPENRQVLERATAVMILIVGLVLLIACANVAALLVVRARGRTKEFTVRLALGAGIWRLARQMLTESLLLSIAGAALGLVVARWSRDLLLSLVSTVFQAGVLNVDIDRTVLLFTFGIALLTGILFGLAPVLTLRRKDLASELKERTSQLVRERRFLGMRGMLVMGQCALSVFALVGAGLFLESLRRAQHMDPGFDTQHLLLARYNLRAAGYSKEAGLQFNSNLVERLSAVPSIHSASFSLISPLSGGGFARGAFMEGQDPSAKSTMVLTDHVAGRYFETAGVRLLAGREFNDNDRENAPRVVIVNETMARRFWPGASPIGKRLRFSDDTGMREVVGLVADAKFFSLGEDQQACIYVPLLQEYVSPFTLLVHANGEPLPLEGIVRGELRRMDRTLPVTISTIEGHIRRSLWAQRMIAGLLAAFGVLGLLLAAVGVYGLTAYSVSQRTSEIGIRIALGAGKGDILGHVLMQGMTLVVPGLLAGVALALASSRFAQSLLFGVGAMHPPTYIGAALVLTLVALVACYLPARRATKVDPVTALRHE